VAHVKVIYRATGSDLAEIHVDGKMKAKVHLPEPEAVLDALGIVDYELVGVDRPSWKMPEDVAIDAVLGQIG
jgi:hypothetical protein